MGTNIYDKTPIPVSVASTTGELPDGFVTASLRNTGAADATLTFSDGSTYTLSALEEIHFHRHGDTYNVVLIDATNTTVKGFYTKF